MQEEVLRRIHAREWKPGDMIPNEAELATEFGCARTTVNRALRSLAEAGLLERRRKAGTRVAAQPVAKATLNIAVIRHEVEDRGARYGYQLVRREARAAPTRISAALGVGVQDRLLHVLALHLANDAPYALEDRWINSVHVPEALEQDFRSMSANEWLLQTVPYTRGEIAFAAKPASAENAKHLDCPENSALLAVSRLTWDHDRSVTAVQILFAPGHQMRTRI
ncbi:MAG: UTRA domain-containing protein [Boseongicola sp. SB0676_bin_33]|uniref:UTRA domain-containing protein n=1 Tax=Boseongicola sp. SB0664_bin_43 TaxID=2604844 RepID=A0A6B0XWX9_9RHOB|nr:UTRA domain-containing protein [Boseongicola sp. SB0664_bin_43]MYF88355.1 UTRA domain-containing protein [Boseongicola sp. SB0676_bin_33]MYK31034.1 UTRA domain-containing protein [Boseongicola sp. SB0670_bin_30]